MPGFDTITLNLLAGLGTCLNTALQARPNGPETGVCELPGESFQQFLSAGLDEDLCCSGFAAVRMAGVTPQSPAPGVTTPCGVLLWRVDLEMGVARCAPFGDANAGPDCAQWLAVTEQVHSDLAAMLEAQCCFADLPAVGGWNSLAPTGWVPFGPEGHCTGGIMGLSVIVNGCQCGSH